MNQTLKLPLMKTGLLLFILFSYLNIFSQEVGLIANFPFNNSATSVVNPEAFTDNIAYTTDRNGIANQALSRSLGLSYASISNLPIGSSERTISVWFKLPVNSGEVTFFEYGSGTTNSRFFLAADSFFIPSMQGFSFGAPPFYQLTNYVVTPDVWYHYVVTASSSGTVKQYVNGVLLATYTGTINTSSDNSCYIAGGYNGAIDDLKIYNRAVTDVEVSNLYYYNNVVVPTPLVPSIASITTTTMSNSATINYSLNANNASTTSIVRYGLTSGNLNNQITGFNANFNSSTSGNANITGLISNTQYFYQIEATNSAGTSQSVIGSFTTTDDTPLANYLFNNTYANINSQSPFSSTNTTFVNDRNNQPTNAISVGSTSIPIAATIPNIPLGNSIRSVSFWFKKPAHSVAVGLFAYGANANQQTFGLYLGAGGNFVFQTFGNDHDFGGTSNANTWIHAILTYNGASAKLYVNGILIGQSINFTLNTQNTAFKIGGNGAIVEFDDLKIFNYELTQAQVTSLFNNNTLSSSDFNQDNLKVVLYPNPVRDILNIETELEIQSIEIYNIQGQKVLSSNQKQINVSDLAVGMYMVRIQDVANNIAIKKIVIK